MFTKRPSRFPCFFHQLACTQRYFASMRRGTGLPEGTQRRNPENQLLVEFQGMIAEYERAQMPSVLVAGKRHLPNKD